MNKNLSDALYQTVINNWFETFRNATSPKQWYLQIDYVGRFCRSLVSTLDVLMAGQTGDSYDWDIDAETVSLINLKNHDTPSQILLVADMLYPLWINWVLYIYLVVTLKVYSLISV